MHVYTTPHVAPTAVADANSGPRQPPRPHLRNHNRPVRSRDTRQQRGDREGVHTAADDGHAEEEGWHRLGQGYGGEVAVFRLEWDIK
jgi:hypothetical protein